MKEINFNVEDIEKIDLSMDVGIKEIYPPLENLEVVPTKQKQIFKHENSYGYDNVTVNPISDEYIIPSGTLPITENTTYDVREYAKVSASVHPAPNLQDKEVTPTKEGQVIVADNEYDGLRQVNIYAVTNEIDSNIQASNIKSGVSILGVTGILQEGYSASIEENTLVLSSGSVEEGELIL